MSSLERKLLTLGDAAKFDASCSSSGSTRPARADGIGNAFAGGICHTWAADGRCVSLLKVLQSNNCCYDCAYCVNRASNDVPRATFEPDELSELTIEFYRRNYIEGLFLSSAVHRSPDYTMSMMHRTLYNLREVHKFCGYIHVKTIPGADPYWIEAVGLLADRISVNIELPTSDSLALLAPQKKPEHIITPMRLISQASEMYLEDGKRFKSAPKFAPAGQSTQMIIGATPDTDRQVIMTSSALYKKFKMRRVYYSAYIPVGSHAVLPERGSPVPLLREHRLYQADWLMRYYNFQPGEIIETESPMLDVQLDPKCAWALRHPEFFPVECNAALPDDLLRVPGVGVTSMRRIVAARRQAKLRPEDLRKMGVVMKRAKYFLTAGGQYASGIRHDHPLLREMLVERPDSSQITMFDRDPVPRLYPVSTVVTK